MGAVFGLLGILTGLVAGGVLIGTGQLVVGLVVVGATVCTALGLVAALG